MLEKIRDRTFELELAGGTYRLIFDMNALAELEQCGVDLSGLESAAIPPFRVIRAMVWAGLRTHHPELTIEQVGALILPEDIQRISEILGRAMMAAFGMSSGKGAGREEGGEMTGPSTSTTGAAGTSRRKSSGEARPPS